jgi:hypothetical protein
MKAVKKGAGTKSKIREVELKQLPYEWQRVAYYFELLDQNGPAEDLWKMLKWAMIADNDHIDQHDRSNMLFFYEYTKELFQNTYALLQQQIKEKA